MSGKRLGQPAAAALVCICAMALASCSGAGPREVELREGWMSEDCFSVMAVGTPGKWLARADQRKASAREAAISAARALVLEKFVGIQFEGTFMALDFHRTRDAMRSRFGGTIQNGRIRQEHYDTAGNCRITYQVEEKGLRKSVMSFGIRE